MILHLVTGIEDVRLGGRKPRSLGKTLRENGSGKKTSTEIKLSPHKTQGVGK